MAWTTSLTTFRSCLVSLDDKEAWNLQVMQCMMGFYKQNMQNVHNMQQNMQQNIPVAQFTNPSSQNRICELGNRNGLLHVQSCQLAAVFVVPVATSVVASREVFQNYGQTTNDMKRPNASRSFPKKSKKRLPGATGHPPSPGILLRFPALFPLGTTASPSDRSQPPWWGRRSESSCPDSRLELGLKAMSFVGQLLTFEIVWVFVLWWSLSEVLVFCFGQLGPDSRVDRWRVPRWLRSLSSNSNHLGTHRLSALKSGPSKIIIFSTCGQGGGPKRRGAPDEAPGTNSLWLRPWLCGNKF